jgi:integration host factor subunit alpha
MHYFLSIFLYHKSCNIILIYDYYVSKKKITRATLRDAFQSKLNIDEQESYNLLETILDTMKQGFLASDTKCIKISSFGTFVMSEKKQRMGRNPRTLVESVILPRKNILFRASKSLLSRLNAQE